MPIASARRAVVAEDGLDRLRAAWERLPEAQRAQLVAFAEFLVARYGRSDAEAAKPKDIPRPPGESVVQALRRLTATYPMLDTGALLDEASGLMSRHVLEGRPAEEVIDGLEALFRRHYRAWADTREGDR